MQVYGDIIQSSRCGPGEGRVEIIWIDPDTGEVTDHQGFRGFPYGDLDGPAAPDAAGPGPSVHGPVRDSVAEAIPDRVVQLNPFPRGMTGMATWLWYDGDGDDATAAITSFCWDVDGDGVDERCTDRAGSQERPAFTTSASPPAPTRCG